MSEKLYDCVHRVRKKNELFLPGEQVKLTSEEFESLPSGSVKLADEQSSKQEKDKDAE